MNHCEPASSIISLLGGVTAVSRGVSTSHVTVLRWRLSKKQGGTGGFIPRKHHARLAAMAKDQGLELPPAAFLDVSLVPARSDKESASPEAA